MNEKYFQVRKWKEFLGLERTSFGQSSALYVNLKGQFTWAAAFHLTSHFCCGKINTGVKNKVKFVFVPQNGPE